jgi:hypothetical protein
MAAHSASGDVVREPECLEREHRVGLERRDFADVVLLIFHVESLHSRRRGCRVRRRRAVFGRSTPSSRVAPPERGLDQRLEVVRRIVFDRVAHGASGDVVRASL